jgi:hypothetical protein
MTPSGGGLIGLCASGEGSAGGRLKGRVAIITGAGTVSSPVSHEAISNGQATAIAYAAEDARMMAVDIDGSAANETWRMRNILISLGKTFIRVMPGGLSKNNREEQLCEENRF